MRTPIQTLATWNFEAPNTHSLDALKADAARIVREAITRACDENPWRMSEDGLYEPKPEAEPGWVYELIIIPPAMRCAHDVAAVIGALADAFHDDGQDEHGDPPSFSGTTECEVDFTLHGHGLRLLGIDIRGQREIRIRAEIHEDNVEFVEVGA